MKIKYLGTAAAEGIPALFCECDTCKKAKRLGGKNIRTRSQTIIDNKILIDFPSDTYMHYLKYDFPLSRIKTCLITHSHCDHLYVDDAIMRDDICSHISNKETLIFYSAESGYKMLKTLIDKYNMFKDVSVVLIEPFKPFLAEGYKVTPLEASHYPESTPVIFLIEKDGKSLLYSNDTSEYPDCTWEFLKEKKINFISMDCTEAVSDAAYMGHLTLKRNLVMRERMYNMGIADKETVFALNHFSHNGGNVTYDDFSKIAEKYGYLVSYDGMEYDI